MDVAVQPQEMTAPKVRRGKGWEVSSIAHNHPSLSEKPAGGLAAMPGHSEPRARCLLRDLRTYEFLQQECVFPLLSLTVKLE